MSVDSIVTLSVFAKIFGLGVGVGALIAGLTIKFIQRRNSKKGDFDD